MPLYNCVEVTYVQELWVCWHWINAERPGLCSQTHFPIKSSSSSPGESQTSLSSRSSLEFIVDFSEAFARAVERVEDDGVGCGEGGKCDISGGSCLLANKTPAGHRPAEAPAIKAVTQSVDRAHHEFCLVNLQWCLDHCTHCRSRIARWQLRSGERKRTAKHNSPGRDLCLDPDLLSSLQSVF